MKLSPIVQFLQTALPLVTSYFSDTTEITHIIATAGTATATTLTPHNLTVNETVTITNAIITVSVVSLTVSNGIGTLKTLSDHGMTLNFDYKTRSSQTVLRIRGDNDPQLNDDFIVIDVPNRFYVTFTTTLPNGTYTIDGAKVLYYPYNYLDGRYKVVSTPSTTTFTYNIATTNDLETVEPATLHANVRITGCSDVERAETAYTNWETSGYINNKFYAFVTHGNTVASKDRNILNDATTALHAGTDYRQKLIEDFDINVFCPVSDDLLAFNTREILEDIKIALIGTMYGLPQFPQYQAVENGIVSFVSDFNIILNRSRLIHGYKFETVYNIYQVDGYKYGNLAPFRDMYLTIINQDASNTQYINLDVDPSFNG